MKIIIYCQHVWGVGHLFRTLEILKALSDHDILMVTGGERIDIPLPNHVREIHLPEIMMDLDYKGFHTTDKTKSFDEVKKERIKSFYSIFKAEAPDLFIIELYPFGRNAFRFELNPVLKAIQKNDLPRCKVICSLRDILVEKRDQVAFEDRVLKRLNPWFDAVLIHSDPNLIRLDDTFSRISDIEPLIHYTGFVTSEMPTGTREQFRKRLNIEESITHLVASAGGGRSGANLLKSVISAFRHLQTDHNASLSLFTGPYLDQGDYTQLQRNSVNGISISRFTDRFLSYLLASDLSISMGGYNTCMNIITTQVPALVLPFSGDREQGIRVGRLERLGILKQLTENDLEPQHLSGLMRERISFTPKGNISIDMNGAINTAAWINANI